MEIQDTRYTVDFLQSKEQVDTTQQNLVEAIIDFLDYYGEQSLLGKAFLEAVGSGDGRSQFRNLLAAAGHPDDPDAFFQELLPQLGRADGSQRITVGGLQLPNLLLVRILEELIPGHSFSSIKDVAQLQKVSNIDFPQQDREALQQVIDTYPVRLSKHTIRQNRISQNVAYQYLPFVEELDPVGHTNTWVGQFHQGLLEQMYQNRVIFLLDMSCPVYCRFCFRKHKETRNEANPSSEDVDRALEHVRNSPRIKEIVVTGGDPFLNKANMHQTIDGLAQIPHVQTLRLATRSVSYYPHLFLGHNQAWLDYLKEKNLMLRQKGKRLELATHFIHPDEISPESLEIITELVKNGIQVYIQTPFLKDCNDQGPELTRLFSLLRGAGAELHYIYIPCSPIHGNSVYWSTIAEGQTVANYLRAHLSDRIIPRICTATPIGKMDWQTSGWAVEQDPDNQDFIWIRSPYTPEYFQEFVPQASDLKNLGQVRANAEGTIDVRYMAKIGDPNLFYGSRPPREPKSVQPDPQTIDAWRSVVYANDKLRFSLVPTGSEYLFRPHETRMELDVRAADAELAAIQKDERITDVILSAPTDCLDSLHDVCRLIQGLRDIKHVNAIRLRSFCFNTRPEAFSPAVLHRLEELNKLSIVNPQRLEIESWFLHSSEMRDAHRHVADELRKKGISVYVNTPLLTDINDSSQEIHDLAYAVREYGLEYHHLYLAGLPGQTQHNQAKPIDLYDILDIATRVRREGSGREIPRYIILTELGEVDYGLTSRLIKDNGRIRFKLLPYDLEYYQGLDPEFTWPAGVSLDAEGRPTIEVKGLISRTDFPLC